MSISAYENFLDALRDHGSTVTVNGNQAKAQCPAHSDNNPSLNIKGTESRTLVYCHALCPTEDVLAALGLTMRDLYNEPFEHPKFGTVYAKYPYSDNRVVLRKSDKSFPQSGNTKGKNRALFHADRIGGAQPVFVVEGEEDVFAIEAVGGAAVCSAMGAGKAQWANWGPLRGKHVIIVADKDETGREHATHVAKLLHDIAASVSIVEAAVGKDASDHIAAGKALAELVPVKSSETIPPVKLTRLADVQPERVSWLWPGYIPVGKLVTLDGDPGVGKSTLALSISAPITTGGAWPDGAVCEHPGGVLIMSAEDGLADTMRPRADAAGADVNRVYAIEGVPIVSKDGERTLRPPTLADIAALEVAISDTGARLLVIDVVMAYLPTGTDSHKDQDIRQVLSRLSTLADRTGCTILLIRHLNKTAGRDPLYRGGGSIGIVGAARAGLLVAPDPDDPDRRVLASIKSNLGPAPESLTYRLVDVAEHGCARVQWEGQTTLDAYTLLAGRTDDEELDEHDYTDDFKASWLYKYLADAHREKVQIRPKDAVAFAADKGISRRTVFRLFDKLANAGMAESVNGSGFPKITHWQFIADTTDHPWLHAQTAGTTGTTGDDLHKQGGTTAAIENTGGTTGETASDQAKQINGAPVVPVVPADSQDTTPPGAPTADTPGMTERVQQIAAKHNFTR